MINETLTFGRGRALMLGAVVAHGLLWTPGLHAQEVQPTGPAAVTNRRGTGTAGPRGPGPARAPPARRGLPLARPATATNPNLAPGGSLDTRAAAPKWGLFGNLGGLRDDPPGRHPCRCRRRLRGRHQSPGWNAPAAAGQRAVRPQGRGRHGSARGCRRRHHELRLHPALRAQPADRRASRPPSADGRSLRPGQHSPPDHAVRSTSNSAGTSISSSDACRSGPISPASPASSRT